MARPTLFNHPKFQRLVYVLGLSRATVIGHLELMWNVGYQSGEPVLGDEIDVELAAEWGGERGAFVRALADPSIRLLDVVADGKYAIHDLHDHAPRYVQDRWRKEQQRKKNGARRQRRTSGGRAADKRRTRGGHDAAIVTSGTQVSATPAPAPAPAPAPPPLTSEQSEGGDRARGGARPTPAVMAPAWRPASGARVAPLIDGAAHRRHGQHARCYRARGLCVTPWVWEELFGRIGGDPDTKLDRLGAWMDEEIATLGEQPVGDPPDDWWRKRFAHRFGVESKPMAVARGDKTTVAANALRQALVNVRVNDGGR